MGFSPYDSGGPIRVGEDQENDSYDPGDGIVDTMQKTLSDDNDKDSKYDISSWNELMASVDDMSSKDLIAWIGSHPDLASANASVLDTLLQQKINRENYDYETNKNREILEDERRYNSYSEVMKRMKAAGINPALAFRTGENAVSMTSASHKSVSSSIASQFAKEASLAESARKTDMSSILGILGAVGGFIGAMILAMI